MRITVRKQNGKISFFQNGLQVYPESISGNQAQFSDGQVILF